MSAAMMLMYWRVFLLSPAVGFSSPEGKWLFSASTMEGFFFLVSVFQTQLPTFYGLTSPAVILNALPINPSR
jgi:hypothetical protein